MKINGIDKLTRKLALTLLPCEKMFAIHIYVFFLFDTVLPSPQLNMLALLPSQRIKANSSQISNTYSKDLLPLHCMLNHLRVLPIS